MPTGRSPTHADLLPLSSLLAQGQDGKELMRAAEGLAKAEGLIACMGAIKVQPE
jgi:hypothetical protein